MQASEPTPQCRAQSASPSPPHCASDSSNTVQSTDLLKGQKSVVIEHNGCIYRLQETRLGKLILTK